MCERKPGPRCSADMKKALTKAANQLEEHPSPINRNKYNDAVLRYNATPEGLSALGEKIYSHDKIVSLKVPEYFLGTTDGVSVGDAITLNIPEVDLAYVDTITANVHRSTQQTLTKRLKDLPTVKAQKEFANIAKATANGNITMYQNLQETNNELMRDLIKEYKKSPTIQNRQKVTEAYLKSREYSNSIQYNSFVQDDVADYLRTI